jgi:hypothetical protein
MARGHGLRLMARVSDEAVARNRDNARLRAAAKRVSISAEDHSLELKKRREYEYANREHINATRQLRYGADNDWADRPFIGWDGEGYSDYHEPLDLVWASERELRAIIKENPLEPCAHHYMLFGCSSAIDDPLVGLDLGTMACLDYLLSIESRYPNAFHVGFAFDYDVNMILRDLESRHLRHLADYGVIHWKGYRIAYIPGKRFTISKGNPKRGETRVSATIYDTFGFFHSKYTTSLLKFGVANEAEIRDIVEGKDERGNFTYADREYVKRYWQTEIAYMPLLMDRVREACYDAGYFIREWHGPGALAAYILRTHGVNQWHSKDVPMEAQIASRYAYAGGRFQFWRFGLFRKRVYTADINSAYIYACSLLPRLDNGRWERKRFKLGEPIEIAEFGIYHIVYDAGVEATKDNHRRGAFEEIHPLFHRDKRGNLFWPARNDGWFWSPEARTVAGNGNARFVEAWIYHGDGSSPFQWVHSEFAKRLQLQHLGNPAEKTIKWALAAMYGAFARTVGWDRKRRIAPRSHELMWAGFITSWCRAEMYKLAYECSIRGGLISIDTDSVTSTVPFKPEWLERGEGENLGQWKLESHAGILYCQSGFYWPMKDDGSWGEAKTRGMKRGSVPASMGLEAWESGWIVEQTLTKFTGFREALKRHRGMKIWRTWGTVTHKVRFGFGGTTFHFPKWCIACRAPDSGQMHIANHKWPTAIQSEPHRLPWLEDNLEELERNLIVHVEDERDLL